MTVGLGAGLGASFAVAGRDIEVAGAARVLRVAGAGAGGAFLVGAALTGAGAGAGLAGGDGGVRSSMSGIWRLVAGTRFTRRSRRERRLAHCASHIARSFSLRAWTFRC